MTSRPKILFTSSLSDKQIHYAEINGLDIHIIHLVETIPLIDNSTNKQILNLADKNILAIFTSQSSLDIITNLLDGQHLNWKIACTSPVTKDKVIKFFGETKIIAEGITSHELAQKIINLPMEFDKIVFFSGTQRKDDIPSILASRFSEKWIEIKVYETQTKPVELKYCYDGIAFCSPSAVDALLENNSFNDATKFFAIGSSTAKILSAKGLKEIIVSPIPDKNKILEDIVNTFK